MFRFWKRTIIFCIIISPLLYIFFIGYPIRKIAPSPGRSARCFKVGELREFVECYREGVRFNGLVMMKDVQNKASSFNPFGGELFFIALCIQILILLAILL